MIKNNKKFPFSLFTLAARWSDNFLTMRDNASQPLLKSSKVSAKPRSKITLITVAVVFLASSLYITSLIPSPSLTQSGVFVASSEDNDFGTVQGPGISVKTLKRGLDQCKAIQTRKETVQLSSSRTRNPRAVPNTAPLLIQNGYIWTGDSYLDGYDILVDNGIIQKVEKNIETVPEYDIIDAKSRVVTPGIIDMHSHIGIESIPMFEGLSDTNEGSSPTTPYVIIQQNFDIYYSITLLLKRLSLSPIGSCYRRFQSK